VPGFEDAMLCSAAGVACAGGVEAGAGAVVVVTEVACPLVFVPLDPSLQALTTARQPAMAAYVRHRSADKRHRRTVVSTG
jgi:hypothetical protein